MFRILDQLGNVRSLKPSQIGIKVDSRFAVAVDQDGYNISPNDSMKEVAAGVRSRLLPSSLGPVY
jgi:transcription elongation factor SPT5